MDSSVFVKTISAGVKFNLTVSQSQEDAVIIETFTRFEKVPTHVAVSRIHFFNVLSFDAVIATPLLVTTTEVR